MKDHETFDDLRPCGVAESALFDYLDVPEMLAPRHAFAVHLAECADCRREVESYRALYGRLALLRTTVPAGIEPRPAFDDRILAALPVYGPGAESFTRAARRGWFERLLADPARVRLGLGIAGASLMAGAAVTATVVAMLGGPRRAVAQLLSEVVRGALDLVNGGVGQLLSFVRASDTLVEVSRLLKPLWNTALTVSGAVGPEFMIVTTLLSLLALLGAVRLAAGSTEREVQHVHFCL